MLKIRFIHPSDDCKYVMAHDLQSCGHAKVQGFLKKFSLSINGFCCTMLVNGIFSSMR